MTAKESQEKSSNATQTAAGPTLLETRSILGIAVHFIAIPTSVAGAGIVYLLATNEFTKRNARNALDWHLTVLLLTIITFGSVFTVAEFTGEGATDVVAFSPTVSTAASAVVFGLVTLWFAVSVWTLLVGFVAMGKAIFGTAWRYPLSPHLVDRYESRVATVGGWPVALLPFVLLFPLVMVVTFAFAESNDILLILSGFGMIGTILFAAPLTAVAIYVHGERDRPQDAEWQPSIVAYIGIPMAVAAAGYVISRFVTQSAYPPGDAQWAFLVAFWLSAIVYLVRWWSQPA